MTIELVRFKTYRKNGLTFGRVIEGKHRGKKCLFFPLWCRKEEPEKIGEGCIIERWDGWDDHFVLAGISFEKN